jgi:hypothetical protein
MKYFLRLSLLLFVLQSFLFQSNYSQDIPSPKVGLSASLQDNQFDILVPIWLGSNLSIAPSIGLIWTQDAGSDLRIALVPRFYFSKSKVSPFLGGRIGLLRATPSVGTGTTDWLLGLAMGGEYFLDNHFSFGIESQINLTISDQNSSRFGNPGKKNLNTATAIFATVYF